MERLQKLLAHAGVGSRRFCEKLIAEGRVVVNGEIVKKLGTKVSETSEIIVDGKKITKNSQKVYILLNKPVGYTCTRKDPHANKTVIDIIGDKYGYIYPAGRLDVNTSGLIILTNDGDFAYLLTHPSHSLKKTYVAVVENIPDESAINLLRNGIELFDGKTAPANVKVLSSDIAKNTATLEITIHEGRNRQIRRMISQIGGKILSLERTRIGSIRANSLKVGEYRHLKVVEIEEIMKFSKS